MQSGTDRINKKRTLERGERGLRLQSPRLIVSGVTGKREKRGKRREREKKATTEGKRKTIKRRIFYNWQPFLLLLAFVSWHGSIFSKKAHNTLKKNMFVPRMTSIHQQRPPPRKYPPPPRFFTLTSLGREELRARNKRTDHFVERDWVWWWSWKMLWMGEIRDFSLRRMEKIVIWIYKSKSGENYNKWAPYKA